LIAGRLELTSVLGVGAYGVVYAAVDIFTCTPFAIKVLAKNGLDARQQKFQQTEIALHMKATGHRNIVSLVKIVETLDCLFVIMEYCPEGDLFTNITERGVYVGNDYMAKRAFLQLLDAVEYCHSRGIYHRDLKPENVLVCERGYEVKLADFGLATTDSVTSDFGCGSTFYMSPECQQSSRSTGFYASAPNDVWSLGVILVNLTCGRNPWKRASQSDSTYRAYLKDRKFLRTILPISQELNSILVRVFEPNPLKRISLQELRLRIMNCRNLTVKTNPMDSPPLSEVSDASECQISEEFNLPPVKGAASEIATPPDTAPATPQTQSVRGSMVFNEPLYSRSSDASSNSSVSQYYAEAAMVDPQPAPEFVPTQSGRTFWPFQFFRKEDFVNIHSRFINTQPGVPVY